MTQRADEVQFINRSSGLRATNIQAAIEELAVKANTGMSKIADMGSGKIMTMSERMKLAGMENGATADQSASDVPYINSNSSLTAGSVQEAIDSLAKSSDQLKYKSHTHVNNEALLGIKDHGSGNVITEDERGALHRHGNTPVLSDIFSAGSGSIITPDERNKLSGISANARGDQDATEVYLHLPEIQADNVSQAISIINERISEAGADNHEHLNSGVLCSIVQPGSGRVITQGERNKLESIESNSKDDQLASEVPFSDIGEILGVDNVQDAINVLCERDGETSRKSHEHRNADALNSISDSGSGVVISDGERGKLMGIESDATADQAASEVPFECEGTGLRATDVQGAIKELSTEVGHQHENRGILDSIKSLGSGHVITDEERGGIARNKEEIRRVAGEGNDYREISEKAISALAHDTHIHENSEVIDGIESLGSGAIITSPERTKLHGIDANAKNDQLASEVPYNRTTLRDGNILGAENVQKAIDELSNFTGILINKSHGHENREALDSLRDIGSGSIISDEERIKLNSIEDGATKDQYASGVFCDGPGDNVQGSLDNLRDRFESVNVMNHNHENELVLGKIIGAGCGSVITQQEREKLASVGYGASEQTASTVPFDGANVGATTVAGAIDKLGMAVSTIGQCAHDHEDVGLLNHLRSAGSGMIITNSERDKLASVGLNAKHQSAVGVPYDGDAAGLSAKDVQHAIDELSVREAHKHVNAEVLARITRDSLLSTELLEKLNSISWGATAPRGADNIPVTAGRLKKYNVADALTALDQTLSDVRTKLHGHLSDDSLAGISAIGSGSIISKSEREKLGGIEPNATADQTAVQVRYGTSNVHDALATCESSIKDISKFGHAHDNTDVLAAILSLGSGSIITREERAKLEVIEEGAIGPRNASQIAIPDSIFGNVADAIACVSESNEVLAKNAHTHRNSEVIDNLRDYGSGCVMTNEERSKLDGIEPFSKRISNAQELPIKIPELDNSVTNVYDAIKFLMDEVVCLRAEVERQASVINSGVILTKEQSDKLDSIEFNSKDDQDASEISYDGSTSGLAASTTQQAIDILAKGIGA